MIFTYCIYALCNCIIQYVQVHMILMTKFKQIVEAHFYKFNKIILKVFIGKY